MPRSSPEKEAYWREMLSRQQRSGQSIRQFCKDHDLSEPSFYGWKREIKKRDGHAAGTAPKRRSRSGMKNQAAQRHASASPFIPLQLTGGPTRVMELVHPRGHLLRIPAVFDENCLHKVLQLLDREAG
jgi:hypothetical protein